MNWNRDAMCWTPSGVVADRLTGADTVIQLLKEQGVRHLFGCLDSAVLPLCDAAVAGGFQPHMRLNAQNAARAARGYARWSARPAVLIMRSMECLSKAGAELAEALVHATPLVVITGHETPDGFHERAQYAHAMQAVASRAKHSCVVRDAHDLALTVHRAFRIASAPQPGPVVVDIPKHVQLDSVVSPRRVARAFESRAPVCVQLAAAG